MMKGLLIKDFKLLKGQKNFFMIIVAIAIGMSTLMEDSSFIIGYLTFVSSLFTLSTISYDEFDNGNAFLFSLPVTRESYVLEKYEFGFFVGGVFWLFATVIVVITELIKKTDIVSHTILSALLVLSVMLIVLAVMLPFQFKFGGEKSRIAILGAVGLLFVIGFVVVKIAELFHIDLPAILNHLPTVSMGMLPAAALGIAMLVLLVSLKISMIIMNRKEF